MSLDESRSPVAAPSLETTPLQAFVGRTIADKYLLQEPVGTGSMGAVFRARHATLHRDVAVKLMAPELASDRDFVARFRREALAASRLAHPNSVLILDFGEEPDGLLYLVMEFVRGPSLEEMLQRGETFSEARTVEILSQVLSALATAHDAGIVHRDLKPANVLVVDCVDDDGHRAERVKVCDFGVAKLHESTDGARAPSARTSPLLDEALTLGSMSRARRLTMVGAVVGTPAYMSPEQASGRPQDARSDLYSLGVVLFEMLTGRLPLLGDTLEETMLRQIDTEPPSPRDFADCSQAITEVCLRALEKDPARRFASARAMRNELRAALHATEASLPVAAADDSSTQPSLVSVSAPATRDRGRRWPWIATAWLAAGVTGWLASGGSVEKLPQVFASRMPSTARAGSTLAVDAPPEASATSTPSAATPSAPALPPPPPEVESKAVRGRVRIGVGATTGVSRSHVQSMVNRLSLERCYRGALRRLDQPVGGRGSAALYFGESGLVRSASVRAPDPLQSAAACIASELKTHGISVHPEAGSATATLTLLFEP